MAAVAATVGGNDRGGGVQLRSCVAPAMARLDVLAATAKLGGVTMYIDTKSRV